jgi:hypothetical protein
MIEQVLLDEIFGFRPPECRFVEQHRQGGFGDIFRLVQGIAILIEGAAIGLLDDLDGMADGMVNPRPHSQRQDGEKKSGFIHPLQIHAFGRSIDRHGVGESNETILIRSSDAVQPNFHPIV